jgi:4'-phosphopantetheinyl transferase
VIPADILITIERECASASAVATELLDEEECTRAKRFRFDADRVRYLQAHVLLRTALSRCRPDVRPEAWRFVREQPNGKPRGLAPDGTPGPEFSLTHCTGLIAVATAADRQLGIDAEPTRRPDLNEDLARKSFAPVEMRDAPLPGATGQLARLWCAKEALAKAVGVGLALDFADLVIALDECRILRAPPVLDPAVWSFSFVRAPDGFTIALAWSPRQASRPCP